MDEEAEVQRIMGMTEEELREWIRAGGRDPRKIIEEIDATLERAKRDALMRMKLK